MLLYRALNDIDIANLTNDKDIYSSLLNMYYEHKNDEHGGKRKNLYKYVHLCFRAPRKYALDCLIGHITGKRLSAGLSPWISTSSDFMFVTREYSIPQAGKYNTSSKRKPIIVIEVPDNEIKKEVEEVKEIREEEISDFSIDLRDGNLEKLYVDKALDAEMYNPDMPGYSVDKAFDKKYFNSKSSVIGFSNYATCAKEINVYKKINKDRVKLIIEPALLDILYACNVDIEKYYDFLLKNSNELTKLIKESSYDIIGNNLIDMIEEYYDTNKYNGIYDVFEYLKGEKKKLIRHIVELINRTYKTDLVVTQILEDNIKVCDYENIVELSETQINDLLMIQKDGYLYKYIHNKGYFNEQNNEIIKKETIRNIQKNNKIKIKNI